MSTHIGVLHMNPENQKYANPSLVFAVLGLVILLAITLWLFNVWKQSKNRHVVVYTQEACAALQQTDLQLDVQDGGCSMNAYAEAGLFSDSYSLWFDTKDGRKQMSIPSEWIVAKYER